MSTSPDDPPDDDLEACWADVRVSVLPRTQAKSEAGVDALQKAQRCVRLARALLPEASDREIEEQAMLFTELSEEALAATVRRLDGPARLDVCLHPREQWYVDNQSTVFCGACHANITTEAITWLRPLAEAFQGLTNHLGLVGQAVNEMGRQLFQGGEPQDPWNTPGNQARMAQGLGPEVALGLPQPIVSGMDIDRTFGPATMGHVVAERDRDGTSFRCGRCHVRLYPHGYTSLSEAEAFIDAHRRCQLDVRVEGVVRCRRCHASIEVQRNPPWDVNRFREEHRNCTLPRPVDGPR